MGWQDLPGEDGAGVGDMDVKTRAIEFRFKENPLRVLGFRVLP